MITNHDWLKPKEKPCFHQIILDCIEKLVECIGRFNKGEIDADTPCQIEKQILVDEFDGPPNNPSDKPSKKLGGQARHGLVWMWYEDKIVGFFCVGSSYLTLKKE